MACRDIAKHLLTIQLVAWRHWVWLIAQSGAARRMSCLAVAVKHSYIPLVSICSVNSVNIATAQQEITQETIVRLTSVPLASSWQKVRVYAF